MGAHDRPAGLFFVTLTAPGRALLPWDTTRCQHDAETACSGDLGCRVEEVAAAVWNASAPRRWNDFITDARRLLAPLDVQYFGSWETQRRGMLHRHTLISAPGVGAKRMHRIVRMLAKRHGFGTKSDVQSISGSDSRSMARTAGYIASYVTKGGERATLLDVTTGELRPDGRGYRPWSASRRWGITLGAVRAERRKWCQHTAAAVAALSGAETVVSVAADGTPGDAVALDLEQEIYAAAGLLMRSLGATWEETDPVEIPRRRGRWC